MLDYLLSKVWLPFFMTTCKGKGRKCERVCSIILLALTDEDNVYKENREWVQDEGFTER